MEHKYIRDEFWLNKPSILFKKDRLSEFFPNKDMSMIEKLNAIARLSIYMGVIISVYKKNYLFIYITILTMAFTVLVYKTQSNNIEMYTSSNKSDDGANFKDSNSNCTKPTVSNPFMNFNIITDNKNKEKACTSYNNEGIRKEIEKDFNYNLYRDVSDLYGKNNSQREYYTMPSTTLPNDQTSFAKWCYNTGSTCKENTIKCAPVSNVTIPNTISYINNIND